MALHKTVVISHNGAASLASGESGLMRALVAIVAFLLASAVTVYPILGYAYLPLVDLPNHIARLWVFANEDGSFAEYYETSSLWFEPNAAIDILWKLTGMKGDPVTFTKATMLFYCVALIFSVMLLSRVATGSWSPWPAGVALIVYNGNLLWGFQNYVFSVPFALFALALWLALERCSGVLRAAVFVPIAVLVFHMHLLAFMVLAIACFGREVQRARVARRPFKQIVKDFLISGFPFLLTSVVYLIVLASRPAGELGSVTFFGSWQQRVRLLLAPIWDHPVQEHPEILFASLPGLLFLLICVVFLFRKNGMRLVLAEKLKGPLIAILIATLLAPSKLNGVALVNIRFPFVVVALFFAGTVWVNPKRLLKFVLVATLTMILCVRAFFFEAYWAEYDRNIRDLREVLQRLPEGSRLFSVRAPESEPDMRFWHISAYAMIDRNAFIPTFFQGSHAVKLRARWKEFAVASDRPPEFRRVFQPDGFQGPNPENYYWEGWQQKYSHLLFLDDLPKEAKINESLHLLGQRGRFSLYRIEE